MSGASLVIATWVFLGLELGLKDALSLGHQHIAPSFMFCFLTFLAMFSSHPRPLWCAIGLGLLMDLTFRVPLRDGTGTATLIGPYALSYDVSGTQVRANVSGAFPNNSCRIITVTNPNNHSSAPVQACR